MNKKYIIDLKYDNYVKKFEDFLRCHNIKYEVLDDLAMFNIETTPMCVSYLKTFDYIDDITEDIMVEVDDIIKSTDVEYENRTSFQEDIEINPTDKELWFREILGVSKQWQNGISGKGVNIAVVDSGVGPHPYLNVVKSINLTKSKTEKDTKGNGTIVAGIIAANTPFKDIKGIAYNCNLYSIKIVEENGNIDIWNVNKAIEWCIDNNIKVVAITMGINPMSFNNKTYIENLTEAIDKARKKGIIVVASVGTTGNKEINIPASIKGTLAITGIKLKEDSVFNYSSIVVLKDSNIDLQEERIDFSAPGADITTTTLKGGLSSIYYSTSIATAYTAGGIALLIEQLSKNNKKYESIDYDTIYMILMKNRINTEIYSTIPQYAGGKGLATYKYI